MGPYLVGITGGIGSGKSTVSQILLHLGYKVYNSDLRAKDLMNKDESIKSQLIKFFGKEVYIDSLINKDLLSKLIFSSTKIVQSDFIKTGINCLRLFLSLSEREFLKIKPIFLNMRVL